MKKDQQVYVHRLENKEGSKVEFDNVLLIDNDGKIKVGAPAISGAKVTAKVVSHLKGDKVVVFKKKRRKGYRVKNGHRQSLTEILIQKIEEKAAAKKAPVKKAEPKAETKAKPAAKKTAAKKTAAKKTTTKKTTAKKTAPKKAE